ncbi:MAG: ABC transporter transmembrane domain-containing protein, partial [Myxococcota bacterium]|nr:ABC transporter transmembrane domain-containing protein [Myxococcota bacterium]
MDEAQRQGTEEGQLARLLRYARPQRGPIRRAVFWSVSNKLLDLAPPGLIGMAVDIVVSREGSLLARWGVRAVEDQLWILAGLTVLIWGLESVTEYLLKWEWQRIAQRLQRSLRGDCYAHLHGLSSAWFSARSPGELLATLNDDVNQLERFLNGGANALLQLATTALTVSAVFFFFSPLVASFAALPIPIILWGSFAFQRRIAPRYHEVRARSAAIAQRLSDTLSGVEVVKSFTAEAREVEALDALSREYEEANQRAINLSAAFSPLIRMAIVIGFTATLVIGGRLALAGELEVGAYGMLVFLTQRLLWPLTSLGATFDLYQRAMASAGRAFTILDETPDLIGGDRALTRSAAATGTIKLEGVHFAYPKRAPVLQDFSLEIATQRCTAIVGPTGSGKSTIARLIARLYDPQEGSITLDQQPLPSFDLGALRRAVGVVSQQVYLFDGTIRENLLYGRPEASEAELIEA